MKHQVDVFSMIGILNSKQTSHKEKKRNKRKKNKYKKKNEKNLIIPSCTWNIQVNPNKKEDIRKTKSL